MDDNAKRIGSAVVTGILLVIWFALKAERCNRQDSYDYSYTPSLPVYTPPTDYSAALDRTQKVLDQLMANDAAYEPAVASIDPIANAANPKHTQCQALDEVVEQTPTWKIDVSDTVLDDDTLETSAMAPFPLYVTREEDGLPKMSPETLARSHLLVEKIVEGADVTAPRLTTKDLLIEVALMPKPVKGQKKIKGAPAPGKPIARGWIYDHLQKRVVCAGFMAVPDAKKGEDATRLDDAQLAKLVDAMPQALRTTPLPDAEANP